MTRTIVQAPWIFTIDTLPALLANTRTVNAFPMLTASSWANLMRACLGPAGFGQYAHIHAPTWSTLALAQIASAMSGALLSTFGESCTVALLTSFPKEISRALAPGQLCVALPAARAQSSLATNHST